MMSFVLMFWKTDNALEGKAARRTGHLRVVCRESRSLADLLEARHDPWTTRFPSPPARLRTAGFSNTESKSTLPSSEASSTLNWKSRDTCSLP